MRGSGRTRIMGLGLIIAALLAPGLARGQEPPDVEPTVGVNRPAGEPARPPSPRRDVSERVGRGSVVQLIRDANPMLWPLGLCSIVTLGFALERTLGLRRARILPRDFVSRFLERLSQGKLDRERAAELCRSNDSPIGRIFGHAVRYWGQPAATIRQALDHDVAAEIHDMKRNVRVLNATATLAPLLGLLGTVVGMVESFDAIGSGRESGVAKSEALAHGISLALIATAIGLGIAILSVGLYYFFLHRVDLLARELDDHARLVVDMISAEAVRSPSHRGPLNPSQADLGRGEPRIMGRVDPL